MSTQQFPRAAGVAVPLFALRGAHDHGTGEILDLIPFIDWLASWHQRVVQLLPLNETAPGEASPYNALSAFALDPASIALESVEEVRRSPEAHALLRGAPRRVARARQRKRAYEFKLSVLKAAFDELERSANGDRHRGFAAFCGEQAQWLTDYALFRALKDEQAWTSWEIWPAGLRHRAPAALADAARRTERLRRFHCYCQWIAAEQWSAARAHAQRRGVLLKGDLPFVCGRDSADVWAQPALFDLESSAGAPPDAFSETGQAWGLPLYRWETQRAGIVEWWRRRARQAGGLYDMFRVDHVVGLFRTYAIAETAGGRTGFVPADEAGQLAQGRAVLAAVLAAGAPATVVAEDLGTVPDSVRACLSELRIPGYKVFRWEQRDGVFSDPRLYPELSVATTGTHDTETIVTWWHDLEPAERVAVRRCLGLEEPTRPRAAASSAELLALVQRIYASGSALAILPIQDLFGWRDRINVPASVDAHNWTYRLSTRVDALDNDEGMCARMAALREMIDGSGRWSAP